MRLIIDNEVLNWLGKTNFCIAPSKHCHVCSWAHQDTTICNTLNCWIKECSWWSIRIKINLIQQVYRTSIQHDMDAYYRQTWGKVTTCKWQRNKMIWYDFNNLLQRSSSVGQCVTQACVQSKFPNFDNIQKYLYWLHGKVTNRPVIVHRKYFHNTVLSEFFGGVMKLLRREDVQDGSAWKEEILQWG